MTRAERIRALLDEYARQRYQNEREQRAREREAFSRDPELETLRARSLALATQSLRAAMDEPDKEKRRAIAGQMRQKGALINAETRRRLRALGLAEDYLEEHYRCPECRDTGYVGDAPARFLRSFLSAVWRRWRRRARRRSRPLKPSTPPLCPRMVASASGSSRRATRWKSLPTATRTCPSATSCFPARGRALKELSADQVHGRFPPRLRGHAGHGLPHVR